MGRFYKTAQPKYIDFMYKQPDALLASVMAKTDKDIDTTMAEIEKLKSIYTQQQGTTKTMSTGMAMTEDEERRKAIVGKYEEDVNALSRKIMEDPMSYKKMGMDISDLRSGIRNNMLTGELSAINKNFNTLDKQIKAWEKQKVDPVMMNRVLAKARNEWGETGYSEGEFNDISEHLPGTIYSEDIPTEMNKLASAIKSNDLTKPEMFEKVLGEASRHPDLTNTFMQEVQLENFEQEKGLTDEEMLAEANKRIAAEAARSVEYLYKEPTVGSSGAGSKIIPENLNETNIRMVKPALPNNDTNAAKFKNLQEAGTDVAKGAAVMDYKQELTGAIEQFNVMQEKFNQDAAKISYDYGIDRSLDFENLSPDTIDMLIDKVESSDSPEFTDGNNLTDKGQEALQALRSLRLQTEMNQMDSKIAEQTLDNINSYDNFNDAVSYIAGVTAPKEIPVEEGWEGMTEKQKKQNIEYFSQISNLINTPLETTSGLFNDENGNPMTLNGVLEKSRADIATANKKLQDFENKLALTEEEGGFTEDEIEAMKSQGILDAEGYPTQEKPVYKPGTLRFNTDKDGNPTTGYSNFKINPKGIKLNITPDAYGRIQIEIPFEMNGKIDFITVKPNTQLPASVMDKIYAKTLMTKAKTADVVTDKNDKALGGNGVPFQIKGNLYLKQFDGRQIFYKDEDGKEVELTEEEATEYLSQLLNK